MDLLPSHQNYLIYIFIYLPFPPQHLTKTYQSSHPSLCYRRLTPHHVDIDLTRFDASGRKDFASLLQEEDDLKVEELTDEEEAVGGGGGGGTGKGSSFSAKKKRERKVSWNDGGTSRFVRKMNVRVA